MEIFANNLLNKCTKLGNAYIIKYEPIQTFKDSIIKTPNNGI